MLLLRGRFRDGLTPAVMVVVAIGLGFPGVLGLSFWLALMRHKVDERDLVGPVQIYTERK